MSSLTFAAVVQNENTGRAVHDFCEQLGNATGLLITPDLHESYTALVEHSRRGALELAWAPPLVAVELETNGLAVALVAVTRSTRVAYHSALFALSKSGLRRPEDLNGVTVAWVSKESASGYFVPRWHLRSLGLSLAHCFGRELLCESHQAVVRAVLDGEADVGATHVALDPVLGQLVRAPWQTLGAPASAIRVLMLVGPIPGDVIAAGPSIPTALRRRITAALLSMNQNNSTPAFDATRFEPVPDGHLRLLCSLHAKSRESGR